jgi:hypothetical protein
MTTQHDVVFIELTPSGPLFVQEKGCGGPNSMTVNGTQYMFDHSVEDVPLYQNYNLHGVTTLVNMRVMGNHIVVGGKNDVKQVVALWTKWLKNNQDLPELPTREPTGLNLPSNTPAKRKKAKIEEEERDTVIDTKDEDSEDEEDEEDEDENEENEEDEEKGDELIIE